MDPNVPGFISWMFILTTLATIYMLYYALRPADKKVALWTVIIVCCWLLFTAILSISGFYLEIRSKPFRFFLAAPIVFLTIIILFIIPSSRKFFRKSSLEILTYLSAVRVPVELTLWWLFLYNQVPRVMTFEGRNFDIIAGITAPIVGYFVFTRKSWSKTIAYVWNAGSLLLLLNIIAHAVLSLPTPFQMISLGSPNWGMLYFPYIWLPAFVAPTVFLSHLVSIMQLRHYPFPDKS